MTVSCGTVYIVDDDALFRKTLERMIRNMGFQTGSFDSAESFLNFQVLSHPSCLVLDVFMPGLDGLSLQKKLFEKEGIPPIIFVTGHGDVPMSVRAIKNGAEDFLLKPFEAKDLKNALERAVRLDIRNEEQRRCRAKFQTLAATLTPKEREVMRWMVTGKLNKQIGHELGIAEQTVRLHRSRVLRKMGLSSIPELIRVLTEAGYSDACLSPGQAPVPKI
jgi:FixJ family two-component response regulator